MTLVDRDRFYWQLLHLTTLCVLAIAQPTLELLGQNADFFIGRDIELIDLLLLPALLSWILPLLVALTTLALHRMHKVSGVFLHRTILAILTSLLLLPVLKNAGLDKYPVTCIAIALLLGTALTIAYHRLLFIQRFASFLSVSLIAVPLIFVWRSPLGDMSNPDVNHHQKTDLSHTLDNSPPVVFLLFDELALTGLMDSNHLVDGNLFPHFKAFSENAFWFRNSTTVATSTKLAVPAILSGNYPKKFQSPSLKNYPQNLFTLLGQKYAMNVYEGPTRLCPKDQCAISPERLKSLNERLQMLLSDASLVYLHLLLPSKMSESLPSINQSWGDFWQSDAPQTGNKTQRHAYGGRWQQIQAFINSIKPTRKPSLNFIHMNFPHVPYQYLPSGKSYQGGWDIPGLNFRNERWNNDEELVTQAYQRFLLQLMAADTLLGNLVNQLKKEGLYDQSLIVITADHGVSFRTDSARRGPPPADNLNRDILPVPLFIKKPFQKESVISDQNTETIDILPTILQETGIKTKYTFDGQPLISDWLVADTHRPMKTAYYGYRHFRKHQTQTEFSEMYKTLGWKLDHFSNSKDPTTVYRFGKNNQFFGQDISLFKVTSMPDFKATLKDGSLYQNVDLDSGFIPARVRGTLVSAPEQKQQWRIAIAINDKIGAVTRVYRDENGANRFSAMLPEQFFIQGKNRMQLYLIKEDSNRKTQLLAQEASLHTIPSYRLENSGDKALLQQLNPDQQFPIVKNRLKGKLELFQQGDGSVELFGWALDIANKTAVKELVVFHNNRFIHVGNTHMRRGQSTKYQAKGALAGFHFVLPTTLFQNLEQHNPRVFAISNDGYAAELEY